MAVLMPSLLERYALPPEEIELRSMRRVASLCRGALPSDPTEQAIAVRMVYATGDPTLASLIRISQGAARAGITALRAGATVAVDVRMVEVGLDQRRLSVLRCPVQCALDYIPEDGSEELPRTALGMGAIANYLDGGVAVIGTAPTALLALLDAVDLGAPPPALIIATPPGFVAAPESKQELAMRSIPYIAVRGTHGGAALAVAAFNALVRQAVGQ
jgi:precorrin-8X/cobalt-precorrin-8 methylmutase